jgi:hypothetical protein
LDEYLIDGFLEKIFSGNTDESVESIIAITRLLSKEHLDRSNAYLFLKIIDLNINDASDVIFSNRSPETFFSSIIPFYELVNSCLLMMIRRRPAEFYFKNILSCFGILQMTYKNPKYGFNIYKLSITEIQHIGKYLILDDARLNDIIIDVLTDIWRQNGDRYKDVSIKAKDITDCFFDDKKRLSDVIPDVILM